MNDIRRRKLANLAHWWQTLRRHCPRWVERIETSYDLVDGKPRFFTVSYVPVILRQVASSKWLCPHIRQLLLIRANGITQEEMGGLVLVCRMYEHRGRGPVGVTVIELVWRHLFNAAERRRILDDTVRQGECPRCAFQFEAQPWLRRP